MDINPYEIRLNWIHLKIISIAMLCVCEAFEGRYFCEAEKIICSNRFAKIMWILMEMPNLWCVFLLWCLKMVSFCPMLEWNHKIAINICWIIQAKYSKPSEMPKLWLLKISIAQNSHLNWVETKFVDSNPSFNDIVQAIHWTIYRWQKLHFFYFEPEKKAMNKHKIFTHTQNCCI